ncbi:MAG: hypothetical protein QW213_07005 [Thermoproteota archaeon]
MEFRELTNSEWELIRFLLPPRAGTGRPRIDDRIIVNGILYGLLLVAVGWICLLSMAHIRLLGIGLSVGVLKVYGLMFSKH